MNAAPETDTLGCSALSTSGAAGIWLLDTARALKDDDKLACRLDPVATRELLELDRHAVALTYANALILCLAVALKSPPCFAKPGTEALSFDEAWLVRLVERSRALDAESVAFLISSRVSQRYRAALAFLADGLAARLDGIGTGPAVAV